MRRAAKRDLAEPQIVEALEKIGAKVYRQLPVDLLVFFRDRFYCLEVKTPGEPNHSKGRCEGQDEFIKITHCPIVKTELQAIAAITLQS
jgi:hypothetical protein